MIISEETDYFIYGCISTIFVESILCIIYGYCYETECGNFLRRRVPYERTGIIDRRHLITEHGEQFDNSFQNIPDNKGDSSPSSSIPGSNLTLADGTTSPQNLNKISPKLLSSISKPLYTSFSLPKITFL